MLPFLSEIIISFEIFCEHLWLLLKCENGNKSHVTKLMTSKGSFQRTTKRKNGQCFRLMFIYRTTKNQRHVKELPPSFL